jgi:hypothetical protein
MTNRDVKWTKKRLLSLSRLRLDHTHTNLSHISKVDPVPVQLTPISGEDCT